MKVYRFKNEESVQAVQFFQGSATWPEHVKRWPCPEGWINPKGYVAYLDVPGDQSRLVPVKDGDWIARDRMGHYAILPPEMFKLLLNQKVNP